MYEKETRINRMDDDENEMVTDERLEGTMKRKRNSSNPHENERQHIYTSYGRMIPQLVCDPLNFLLQAQESGTRYMKLRI